MEREGLLFPETNQTQVDVDAFEKFSAVRSGYAETYRELAPTDEQREAARTAWVDGDNADLTVKDLDTDSLLNRINNLKAYKANLLKDDSLSDEVKQLYRWKTNEEIASVNMLMASKAGDMKKFATWNRYIYGRPNDHIYKAALDWIANDADELLAGENKKPEVILAAENVRDSLKDMRGNRALLIPNPEIFRDVREDHIRPLGYYGLLLAGVEIPSGKVSNEVGDQIVKYVVENNLQCDYDLIDSSDSWGVVHSQHAIERPAKYNLPTQRFIGLGLGHEIGSHLLEKVNGERSPLKLASIGLDRYELGNEGRAVIREQIQYETFDEFGKLVRWRDLLRRHIAISYAAGTDESEPHSSSETYRLINAIDTMYQSKLKFDTPEDLKAKAADKTSKLLLRVLKGTDGTGGAYYKDKVYLEGVVANWLTAAAEGPSAISNGDLGKFDINNPRHIMALKKVGLLPENS